MLRCLVSGLVLLMLSVPQGAVRAQGLGLLSEGEGGGNTLVQRERIAATARESFDRYLQRAISQGESGRSRELSEAARRVKERFDASLEETLDQLQGDGMLGYDEVSESVGRVRARFEQEAHTIISAIRDGHSAPPLLTSVEPGPTYYRRVLGYTLFTRNEPVAWLRLLAFLLGGLILAWGVNKGADVAGERIRSSGLPGPGSLLRSLAGPLYLSAIALGLYFGLREIWVPSAVDATLDGLVNVIFVGALFWFLWNATPSVATTLLRLLGSSRSREYDNHAHNIMLRSLRVILLAGLALVVIRMVLDTSVTHVLTGLGIVGVAIYIVLRGTIENIAASFTLFSDEPFRVGDMIIFNDQWGTVENIGFRSTEFRTFDGHLITIPNRELIDVPIENAGARPSIRRRFQLGLDFGTAPDKIREAVEIIETILDNHEGMPESQPPNVVFQEFGEYDLRLLVQYFYAPPDYWKALEFDMKVNIAVVERFEEAGIRIAYPTRTNRLEASADTLHLKAGLADHGEDSK